jgi:hypothetical protein
VYRLLPFLLVLFAQFLASYGAPKSSAAPPPPRTTVSVDPGGETEGGPHVDPNGKP